MKKGPTDNDEKPDVMDLWKAKLVKDLLQLAAYIEGIVEEAEEEEEEEEEEEDKKEPLYPEPDFIHEVQRRIKEHEKEKAAEVIEAEEIFAGNEQTEQELKDALNISDTTFKKLEPIVPLLLEIPTDCLPELVGIKEPKELLEKITKIIRELDITGQLIFKYLKEKEQEE